MPEDQAVAHPSRASPRRPSVPRCWRRSACSSSTPPAASPRSRGCCCSSSLGGIGVGHRRVGEAVHAARAVRASRGDGSRPTPTRSEPPSPATSRRAVSSSPAGASSPSSPAAAVGALGLAAIFPIRSLGPRPGAGLKETPWRKGSRGWSTSTASLVADELAVDGVITVFPEGHTDAADAPTLLIRLRPGTERARRRDARATPPATSSPTRSCARTRAARSGCTRRRPACCSARATSRRSTSRQAAGRSSARHRLAAAAADRASTPRATWWPQGDFSGPVGPGFWDRSRS